MTHPYATAAYARVLANNGFEPHDVVPWRTSVLCRPIAETGAFDAMGCYPVTILDRDADLQAGLSQIKADGFVSVVLVVDPFLRPSMDNLEAAFDFVRPFKTHYIHDCDGGTPSYSKHHRYELSRASAAVRQIDLGRHLDDWNRLYGGLVARHGIKGVAAFSRASFERLAEIPGLVCFGAFVGEAMVGAHLWIVDGHRVHSHLAASDESGFASGAGYVLYDAAINYFQDADTIDFGGGAGLQDDKENGLSRFKSGFSNRTEMAYLCGGILDPSRYDALCNELGSMEQSYFPAYRGSLLSRQGADA